jgi:hypothetical protein
MEPTARSDYFSARAQPEMVCIAQDNACVELCFQRFEAHAFDCARRADSHKDWRLDNAAARREDPGACFAVAGNHFKSDRRLVDHYLKSELGPLYLMLCTSG